MTIELGSFTTYGVTPDWRAEFDRFLADPLGSELYGDILRVGRDLGAKRADVAYYAAKIVHAWRQNRGEAEMRRVHKHGLDALRGGA